MRLVVKIGGSLLEGGVLGIVDDLRGVCVGNEVVIVHGGADDVTRVAERMGKRQVFVTSASGYRSRYTDRETMEIFEMVVGGKINKGLVSLFQKNSMNAVGLCGTDGFLIRARRKSRIVTIVGGKKRFVEGDYTGKIEGINKSLLEILLRSGYVPVIAPIGLSHDFETLNLDGDRVAAYVAWAIGAETLVDLSNVDGVVLKGNTVGEISLSELDEMIERVGQGMKMKLLAAKEALQMGVKEVIIANGARKSPVTSALNHKRCTVIKE